MMLRNAMGGPSAPAQGSLGLVVSLRVTAVRCGGVGRGVDVALDARASVDRALLRRGPRPISMSANAPHGVGGQVGTLLTGSSWVCFATVRRATRVSSGHFEEVRA